MEVVLPDGRLTELGSSTIEGPGYDLRGLFIGAEGTLGIATRITVRLLPRPESRETLVAEFSSPEQAGEVVSAVIAAGIVPAAVEMLDNLAIQACEVAVGAGFSLSAGAALIIEVDGPVEECAASLAAVQRICASVPATRLRIARDESERSLIWRGRKSAFAAMGRISPSYLIQDGVIPRTMLGPVLREISLLSSEAGLRVANVFHAGDGNLHPLVLYRAADEDEARRAEELSARILEVCVSAGGSITGEHGVGLDKACAMPLMFSAADLELMKQVRSAFDPHGLCNPDKVFPTPRLCGETPGPYRRHPVESAGLAERW
jgi:glycolate oxidase